MVAGRMASQRPEAGLRVGKGLSAWEWILSRAPSQGDTTQRKDLRLVAMEFGAVLDDALADCLEVLHLSVAEVREQFAKSCNVILLLLPLVVTIGTELEEDLVICCRSAR